MLTEAAALGVVQVHFSGGEPLVRRDLAELVQHARQLDLYTHLSTGGTLADEAALERLREPGSTPCRSACWTARPEKRLAGRRRFVRQETPGGRDAPGELDFPSRSTSCCTGTTSITSRRSSNWRAQWQRQSAGAGPRAVHRLGVSQSRRACCRRGTGRAGGGSG